MNEALAKQIVEQDAVKKGYLLIQCMSDIKEHATCSICLEIYNEPTVTKCSHVFCAKCINKHFEFCLVDAYYCPVCLQSLNKNDTKSLDDFFDMMSYISTVQNKLEELFDYNELNNVTAIIRKIKNDEKLQELCFHINTTFMLDKLKEILHLQDVPEDHLEPPAEPRAEDYYSDDFLKMISNSFQIGNCDEHSPLMKNKQTSNKVKEKEMFADKINKFEDENNKNDIIRWLSNSQNLFHNKSFTQENQAYNSEEFTFDMPSISQRFSFPPIRKTTPRKTRIQQKKLEDTKIRRRNNIVTKYTSLTLTNSKRTRSLECINKRVKKPYRLKRHSIGPCESDEIIIENFNSEEIAQAAQKVQESNALEEKITVQSNRQTDPSGSFCKPSTSGLQKRATRTTSKLAEVNHTKKTNGSTGWDRIKDAKKTMGEPGKKLKKLNVEIKTRTLRSSVKKSNEKKGVELKTYEKKSGEAVSNIISDENKEKSNSGGPKAYDLNTVEVYFNNNMDNVMKELNVNSVCTVSSDTVTQEKVKSVSRYEVIQEKKQSVSGNKVIEEKTKSVSSNKVIQEKINPSKRRLRSSIPESQDVPEENVKEQNTESVENNAGIKKNSKICTTKRAKRSLSFSNEEENKILADSRKEVSKPAVLEEDKKIEKTLIKPSKAAEVNKNNLSLKKASVSDDDEDDDAVFQISTQIILTDKENNCDNLRKDPPQVANNANSNKNDLLLQKTAHLVGNTNDDIFTTPTQILPDEILSPRQQAVQQRFEELGNIFEDCSLEPSKFVKLFNWILKEIDEAVGGNNIIYSPEKRDVQTNTLTCTEELFLTDNFKTVAVQTDSVESSGGFKISSTDLFSTRSLTCAEVQTEPLVCDSCNKVFSRDNVKKNPSTCNFSQTLNNFEFETEEIIKERQILLNKNIAENHSNFSNKISGTVIGMRSDNPLQGNLSDIPSTSKQVEVKKSYKRVRQSDSDSDTSSDVLPKDIKKNKYVQSHLSIDFVSEPMECSVKQTEPMKKDTGSSAVPSQECLERIFKDCDDDFKPKTTRSARQEPLPKRSKTQDMITECEMIMKEAFTNTIRLENTEICNKSKVAQKYDPKPSFDLHEEFSKDFSGHIPSQKLKVSALQKKANNTKKLSESLFTSGDFPENLSNISKTVKDASQAIHKSTKKDKEMMSSLDELIEEFGKSEDTFEDAEVELINESVVHNSDKKTNNKKIIILQDVRVFKTPDRFKDHEDEKIENDKQNNTNDSDLEVVESTPQKSQEQWCPSQQAYYNPEPVVLPPPPQENLQNLSSSLHIPSDFNETFTPPLQFQDGEDTLVNKRNEIVEKVSDQYAEVINNLLKNNQSHQSLTPDLVMLQPKRQTSRVFETSTPFNENPEFVSSIALSPINNSQPQRNLNPLQVVRNSKYSPLTIVKCKTPTASQQRTSLITSTPKQKSILCYAIPKEDLNSSICSQRSQHASSYKNRRPCVACTRMSKEQLFAITSLSNKKLISYSSTFSGSVSHMIVAVGENKQVADYTMKFVLAVGAGIWVLSFDWIEECLRQGNLVPEEPFEALDGTGIDGPRQSRLNRLTNPLLRGCRIFVAPPFVSATQEDVENVIKLLGGELVHLIDELKRRSPQKISLIVTEVNGSQDFEIYESWLEKFKVLTVDLEWLTRSVAQYKLLSLRPFILCTEDSVCDLGYPSELLTEVPFSQTNTFGAT